MKKLFIIVYTMLVCFLHLQAQDRSYLFTNTLNPYITNPALVGGTGNINAVFNGRSYVSGIEGLPRMFNFTINSPILNQSGGLGLKVMSDRVGVFQSINSELAYSKFVKITDEHVLSLGLSLGFVQSSIRQEFINGQVDLSDPNLVSADLNKVLFTSGAGFNYKYKNIFDVGVSFPTLTTGNNNLNGTMVVNSGYNYYTGAELEWKLRPVVNYYNFLTSPNMLDVGLMAEWNKTLRAQTLYRSNNSVIFSAGFNVKYVGLNYAYYMNTSSLQNLAPAQNEIAIVFNFNVPKKNSLTKSKSGNEEELIQDELEKFSTKINGLINVEKSNPGLVNMKKQLDRIAKDLDKILSKYKITNPDQLAKIRNLQDSLDVLIANYSK
jgi:type IX secretion system PorP/SprF family membrane protein